MKNPLFRYGFQSLWNGKDRFVTIGQLSGQIELAGFPDADTIEEARATVERLNKEAEESR